MLQRLLVLVALVFAAPLAGAEDFVAGRDYIPIEGAAPAAGDKIEVVEVFGYSCPHCAHAAPVIAEWRKSLPSDVQLSFMPAVFGGVWEAYGRAYYTAETMGVVERTHDVLFDELHVKNRSVQSLDDIAAFYAEYGVDKETFLATMTSFAVDAKIAKAKEQVPAWGVEGTPTMVVAGKYRVMSPGGTDGYKTMLKVVDFLVAKERAAKKSA